MPSEPALSGVEAHTVSTTLSLRASQAAEKLNVASDFGWRRSSRLTTKLVEGMGFSPGGTSAAEAATENRPLIAALKACPERSRRALRHPRSGFFPQPVRTLNLPFRVSHGLLPQSRFHSDALGPLRRQRHNVARDERAIYFEGNLIAVPRALDGDVIGHAAELARGVKAAPVARNDRRDHQPVIAGADSQNPLRDGVIVPCSRAGQPRILGFAVGARVAAGDHLRIYVRLAAVDVADFLAGRRI